MSKVSIQLSSFDQTWVRPQRRQSIPMSLSVASSYSWGVIRALVRAQHAVARELEVRRVQPAAGAVDAAVGGTLHDEGVLHPAALAPLIHAPAARHHLEQPG